MHIRRPFCRIPYRKSTPEKRPCNPAHPAGRMVDEEIVRVEKRLIDTSVRMYEQ